MLRVSKMVSLESWLHFGFGIKTQRDLPSFTYSTRELKFNQPSSVLWKPWFSQGGSRLLAIEVKNFQLSNIVTKGSILGIGKDPSLVKLIFVWQKISSNLIQKLFMTETVSTVIVKSCLLCQDPASCYHLKELYLRCWRRPGSTSDYSIWQSNYSLGARKCHIVQFNYDLWGIWK